ncbi:acyl-CoA dehydrogenase family protein [Streptomyces sp. Je 1-4]|uniref:acyl-CoA dehydrogenase family protein n=1 Tax=Streptomyces TaxID=1883 RepID=UPI0021D9B02B|nr:MULTISPECIES: acyl-CoA dehydrogenase family protein [unclassified Streptomyces]UYB44858.1 acyl-CoA dehydrogenase family protein [Streptomyces sp. Je 1-4]UZQ37349.1 acyl-CoA dehydrogenase family protein [Streptomyces sp. Je 1-4] [Streptomyces sp. Je 1-4 4N24]UZQ44766.1 acyl-CoA dehydrogenase family protein [Streptomyces sp. Je 1-4] [Streptomyces sp. Je 1-4 4N24_ara]
MHLAPTAHQERLRTALRSYFREVLPDGPVEDSAAQRAVLRRIGADGMLGLGWPTAYGGQGRGPDEQFVFFDEAYRAGAPVSMVTLNTVGPTLMKYGTQQQKDYFLPRILSGELVFAIGYTEPEAGTDLAALRTRAVKQPGDGAPEGARPVGAAEGAQPGGTPEGAQQSGAPEGVRPVGAQSGGAPDGAHWLINGSKSFTSNAQRADWIWLACRTDPDAPKHRGISIILVPTDAPGFSWTPIETVGGLTTTATYYDGIRVPAGNLVGEENAGWQLITHQLNHERVALAAIGMQAEDAFGAALAYARTPDRETGERPADRPWVRSRLAEAHARLAATRLLNWRLVGDVGAGTLSPGDAGGVKFAGTESTVEVYRMCQEVAGDAALIRAGSPGVFGGGELERMNRAAQINTFGGGVSEVQREIVATMRLGMRRGRR